MARLFVLQSPFLWRYHANPTYGDLAVTGERRRIHHHQGYYRSYSGCKPYMTWWWCTVMTTIAYNHHFSNRGLVGNSTANFFTISEGRVTLPFSLSWIHSERHLGCSFAIYRPNTATPFSMLRFFSWAHRAWKLTVLRTLVGFESPGGSQEKLKTDVLAPTTPTRKRFVLFFGDVLGMFWEGFGEVFGPVLGGWVGGISGLILGGSLDSFYNETTYNEPIQTYDTLLKRIKPY